MTLALATWAIVAVGALTAAGFLVPFYLSLLGDALNRWCP